MPNQTLVILNWLTTRWSALILIAAVWGLFFAYNGTGNQSGNSNEDKAVVKSLISSSNSRLVEKKISDIKIGDKTSGLNPEIKTDSEGKLDEKEVESTWKQISLQMTKSDGSTADIELLRPKWWIETREAYQGNTIYLELAELGAEGNAEVIAVNPSPKIQRGQGNLVTGTFRHKASNLIDLYIECLDKPIGCTANHPFWSVDRNSFQNASELYSGEHVALHNNKTSKVIKSIPRQGIYTVYNFSSLWLFES